MSPVIGYLVPFLAALVIALFFKDIWGLDISSRTFWAVLGGTIGLSVGVLLANKMRIVEYDIKYKDLKLKNGKNMLFLLIQLISLLLSYRYTLNTFGGDLISSIAIRREMLGVMPDPFYISFTGAMSLVGGTMYGGFLANSLVEKKYKGLFLIFMNYVLSYVIYLMGGSRGGALILLFSFLCPLIVQVCASIKKTKLLLVYTVVSSIFLLIFASFQEITLLQGKVDAEKYTFWEYMSVYCGAEIKNLDIVVNQFHDINSLLGYSTFKSFYRPLESLFGLSTIGTIDVTKMYHSYYGVQLGNTHTIYGQTVIDFGLIGSAILMFILGVISQLIYNSYRHALFAKANSMSRTFYPWVYYGLFFSFFAGKIFSEVFCISMIKYVLCYYIINILLFGIKDAFEIKIRLIKIS